MFKLRLAILLGMLACFGSVQAQDDLQEYVNKVSAQNAGRHQAPNNIIDVDLSQFSATKRKTTLDVANGNNYRFINGTLTRDASLDGPILHVGGGCYVEIGNGATISAEESSSNREAIIQDGAELQLLKGGAIRGKKGCTSVLMTTASDNFTMQYGTLYGTLVCEASDATINFNGGELEWSNISGNDFYDTFKSAADINVNSMPFNDVIRVELTGKNNVINMDSDFCPLFYVKAPAKKSGDVLVKVLHFGTYWSLDDVKKYTTWQGDQKYGTYADSKTNTVKLSYDDLQRFFDDPDDKDEHCGCSDEDPYRVDIPCDGLTMKKDLDVPDDDLYWAINGRPEGQEDEYDCEGQVDEGENDVYIRPKAKVRWRWLRWRGCGCQGKHIWVYGTLRIYRVWYYYYWRFIHVMPGGKVIIEDLNGDCDETVFHVEGGEVDYGGDNSHCSGGKYGWYCTGGVIYIRGGWLSGGTCGGWTGPKGKSYHYDGTVHGGIHNYGWHYFYGGTCSGGGSYTIYNYKGGHFYYYKGTCTDGGKIWNEGDLYIDGGGAISCGDIYCIKGGCIYILKKLTFTLRLIITEENIVPGATIVVGGDGYTLTQDDIDRIQIDLPDGYEWKYDGACGCISIIKTTGISNAVTNAPAVMQSYDTTGRQVGEGSKGINIQRMSDGTVRKVTAK